MDELKEIFKNEIFEQVKNEEDSTMQIMLVIALKESYIKAAEEMIEYIENKGSDNREVVICKKT